MIGLRERLDVDCTGIGRAAWHRLEIAAGVAVIDGANQEAFVPQMINLATIGGVSFNKGCYTGQEVVARMEYLGKLKRRMYRAQVAAGQAPATGEELWAPKADSAQGVGRVVNVALAADGGYELLAVVRIADYEHGEVRLKSADGARLEFVALPYDGEA
jgi:folate-binding protein YgfZ